MFVKAAMCTLCDGEKVTAPASTADILGPCHECLGPLAHHLDSVQMWRCGTAISSVELVR